MENITNDINKCIIEGFNKITSEITKSIGDVARNIKEDTNQVKLKHDSEESVSEKQKSEDEQIWVSEDILDLLKPWTKE